MLKTLLSQPSLPALLDSSPEELESVGAAKFRLHPLRALTSVGRRLLFGLNRVADVLLALWVVGGTHNHRHLSSAFAFYAEAAEGA